MNLRIAVPDDAPAIAKVHIDSWRSAYRGLVPDERLGKMDYTRESRRFHKSISEEAEIFYIAEGISGDAGFMALGACRDSDVDQKATGEIYAMYLLPEYWRKGIGRSMCREADLLFMYFAFSQVVLWVFQDNHRARRFYEAMGFISDGAARVMNIGTPLNTLRYRKRL